MGGFFKTPFFLRIPCGHRVRFSPVRFRLLKYGRSRKLNVSARMGRSASLQPRPISLSWITGVHKVLYYVSNFYAKNSSLHQPCSHGHWVRFAHTACPHGIRSSRGRQRILYDKNGKTYLPAVYILF